MNIGEHKMTEYATKDLIETTVYTLKGVTYVPHYRNPSVYVGPGYPRFNQTRYAAHELIDAGAKSREMLLWTRSHYGVVTDEKP